MREMLLKPSLRKLALTAHLTSSVGWLGAVAAYLALAIVGLASQNVEMVRAAYLSMEVIGWFVLVPLSFATLVAGLLVSLSTSWGLFRHWWILVKFVLTTGAVAVLVLHMPAVTSMSEIAREQELFTTDYRVPRTQLAIDAAAGCWF